MEGAEEMRKAVAYLRVSGRGQIKGHGFKRQAETIARYSKRARVQIVDTYRDAYTGTDADRPAFEDMLADLLDNGVRMVIVESLDRFARSLQVQIALTTRLSIEGIALVSASTGENITEAVASDPMSEAMVLMQGVFAQAEKKRLVNKLRRARLEMRRATGRCEGRKPFGHYRGETETVRLIRRLRRKSPGERGKRVSYAAIAEVLNDRGIPTRMGGPWHWRTVQSVLSRSFPRSGELRS